MSKQINKEILDFNAEQEGVEEIICARLAALLSEHLPDAEQKIWHRHPVWFLDGNPIVGYSKLKAGIRLMFWSGMSFEEPELKAGTGKFKDASIIYGSPDDLIEKDIARWVRKSRDIQWDYKNIYRTKGKLYRLK